MNAAPDTSSPTISNGSWLSHGAMLIELVLIVAAMASIAALFYVLWRAPVILDPDESIVLARARIMRGVSFLAIPLIFAVGLSCARLRLRRLFTTYAGSGRLVWAAMVVVAVSLLAVAGTGAWQGVAELQFRSD